MLEQTAAAGRRWRVSAHEESFLRALYEDNPFPDITERSSMACLVNQTPRRIQTWFQNKRQRGTESGMEQGIFSATGEFYPATHQGLSLVASTAVPDEWKPASFDISNMRPVNLGLSSDGEAHRRLGHIMQVKRAQLCQALLLRQQQLRMREAYRAHLLLSQPAATPAPAQARPPLDVSDVPALPAAKKRKARTAFAEALADDLDFGDLYDDTTC